MSMVYANKKARITAGGGVDAVTNRILGDDQKRASKKLRQAVRAAEAEAIAEDAEELTRRSRLAEEAKRVRTAAAVQLDERRFNTSEAKESYVKSICKGQKPEDSATSRVPMLGRGLDTSGSLELDIAELDTEEKLKAERMMERHCLGPAEPQGTRKRVREPPMAGPPKTLQPAPPQRVAEKQNLGDLVKAMSARRLARRAGVGGASSSAQKKQEDQSNMAAAAALIAVTVGEPAGDSTMSKAADAERVSEADTARSEEVSHMSESDTARSETVGHIMEDAVVTDAALRDSAVNMSDKIGDAAPDEHSPKAEGSKVTEKVAETPEHAEQAESDPASVLMNDLAMAGKDASKLQKVLQAAGKLPLTARETRSGHLLYNEVGRVSLRCDRADVKRLALSLRRTWRLGSDAAKNASKQMPPAETVAEVRAEEGGA